MLKSRLPVYLLAPALAAGLALPLAGQFAPAPETYSVTQTNFMGDTGVTRRTSRDGSKVAVERTSPPSQPGGKASRFHTVYDLQKHTSVSWDPTSPSPQCSTGTFGGDWGDPFEMSKEMNSDIATKHYKPSATETVNGVSTQVYEEDMGADGKAKVWLEPKYGLMMRAQFAAPGAPLKTVLETQELSLAKPPESLFAIPAACIAAAAAPSADDRRIAAETGEPASNFVIATTPSPSAESCTVLFRMVEAGSMAIIPGGYQIGIDRDFDAEHTPEYQFGRDAKGTMLVSGGHLTEATQQMKNGVLRIENAPAQFHLEIRAPNGAASTYIYRHCAGPQTTLLLVVKGLDKMGMLADWLWVKAGKQAGH